MKNLFKQIIKFLIITEARLILKKYQPKIIAITGNVGKTSTKDAIYTVMRHDFYVRKSEKSFNSDIGVPLTILGCANAWTDPVKWLKNVWQGFNLLIIKQTYPEWLVLEVGADRPGDIKNITKWLKPNITVVTRFSDIPVHIEYFKSQAEVVKEKGYLVQALKHDGTLIINSDDPDVFEFRNKVQNNFISFGTNNEAKIKGTNYSVYYGENNRPLGITFKVESNGNCLPVKILGTLGQNNIYSALAAIAVGQALGLNLVETTENLLNYVPPKGRMNLIKGERQSIIIDDTYNASPVATISALETLKTLKSQGRRLAVLGDMMELGKYSVEAHRRAGQVAGQVCEALITVGLRTKSLAEAAIDEGLSEKVVWQFNTSVEAADWLKAEIKDGDIILVKGSQSMRMEKVVKAVMQEKTRAIELLVRQEDEWQIR